MAMTDAHRELWVPRVFGPIRRLALLLAGSVLFMSCSTHSTSSRAAGHDETYGPHDEMPQEDPRFLDFRDGCGLIKFYGRWYWDTAKFHAYASETCKKVYGEETWRAPHFSCPPVVWCSADPRVNDLPMPVQNNARPRGRLLIDSTLVLLAQGRIS